MDISQIRKWVSRGEDDRLEFKQKANHPEKIVREMVAFANTSGGHLLVGVSDDKKIIGLKYVEDALYQIERAAQRYCHPPLGFSAEVVTTPDNRKLLVYTIPKSDRRPHFVEVSPADRKAYFRVGESSIQASPELCTILRRTTEAENIAFSYGDVEHKLMQLIESDRMVTVQSFARKTGISKRDASEVLIIMVLANVLQIHPSVSGDKFSIKQLSPVRTASIYRN
jgi:hypothetical protein